MAKRVTWTEKAKKLGKKKPSTLKRAKKAVADPYGFAAAGATKAKRKRKPARKKMSTVADRGSVQRSDLPGKGSVQRSDLPGKGSVQRSMLPRDLAGGDFAVDPTKKTRKRRTKKVPEIERPSAGRTLSRAARMISRATGGSTGARTLPGGAKRYKGITKRRKR